MPPEITYTLTFRVRGRAGPAHRPAVAEEEAMRDHAAAPRGRARRAFPRLLCSLLLPAAAGAETGNLFVLDRVASEVKEFDAATGDFVDVFGETDSETSSVDAMAFHPGTGNLFVADANGVQEFDGETGAFLGTFGETADHLTNVVDLEFHPGTHDLWVVENTNFDDGEFFDGDVRAFDGATGVFLGSIGDTQENLRFPMDLAFHPLQDKFVVGGFHTGEFGADEGVWEFDLSTGDFIGPFGDTDDRDAIGPLAFHPDTNDLAVRENNSSDILVFDELDGSDLMQPQRFAFHPDTGELLVADGLLGEVASLDGESGTFDGVFGQTDFAIDPIDLAFQPTPVPEPDAALLQMAIVVAISALYRRRCLED
jgi:hypothetical protein